MSGVGGIPEPDTPDTPEEAAEEFRTVGENMRERADFLDELADKIEAGDLSFQEARIELAKETGLLPTDQ